MVHHLLLRPNEAQVAAHRWYEALPDMITMTVRYEFSKKKAMLTEGTSKLQGV